MDRLDLGTLGGNPSVAYAVNSQGVIVGAADLTMRIVKIACVGALPLRRWEWLALVSTLCGIAFPAQYQS
jgi:hypothetical protein